MGTLIPVGTGRASQNDELDFLEEVPGWNRGNKGMEKDWIPEQSSVVSAWCLSRLVMGSGRMGDCSKVRQVVWPGSQGHWGARCGFMES